VFTLDKTTKRVIVDAGFITDAQKTGMENALKSQGVTGVAFVQSDKIGVLGIIRE